MIGRQKPYREKRGANKFQTDRRPRNRAEKGKTDKTKIEEGAEKHVEQNNLYTLTESEQFTFYRVPKSLFIHQRYAALTPEAKLLYGLLLDRMGLSVKNGWCDASGFVFIYFAQSEVMECLSCGHDKAGKLFAELELADLIARKKQRLCKPDKIYVKRIQPDIRNADVRAAKIPEAGHLVPRTPEFVFPDSNDNKRNKTDLIDIDLSVCDMTDEIEKAVKENLEYDILIQRARPEDTAIIGELVSIISDTLRTTKSTVCISGSEIPAETVRSRFRKLSAENIEYVLDRLKQNTTEVKNIRAYLLAALYNAPATMNSYYTALVNHDLYGQSA